MTPRQRRSLLLVYVTFALFIPVLALTTLGLTPAERKKVQLALDAVNGGIQHGKELQAAAEQARIESDNANKVAGMAASSAFSAGVTARKAVTDAEQCKKTVAEWEPIIKAVTGPWWFPGLNALIYGAKKSIISLIVIIVGAFVVFLVIKVLITVFSGGTVTAGLGAGTKIFGKLGRWFGRAFKRLLSFSRRHGKETIDNIEHRTIGSDPPND